MFQTQRHLGLGFSTFLLDFCAPFDIFTSRNVSHATAARTHTLTLNLGALVAVVTGLQSWHPTMRVDAWRL